MAQNEKTSSEPSAIGAASEEARKWLGATSPNPPVGAVALDQEGRILAIAAHQRAGGPHAEAALIEICRTQSLLPKVQTLCVTLEPCNHQGRTPPCTDVIIASGIKHIVIGMRDPNPDVKGGGVERLRAAGIEVKEANSEECHQLLHAFAYSVKNKKPWITVKRALDKNGLMIPPAGQKTFTSPESLRLAHQLRKKADAIITGSGTILMDNPLFTVRYVSDYPKKRRWLAILDRRGRVPANYFKAADRRGLDVLIYQDIQAAVLDLAEKGVRDVLVEAGPGLSQAMLDSPLWAMSVTIYQGDPDRVDVTFNSRGEIPFAQNKFRWDWILPA